MQDYEDDMIDCSYDDFDDEVDDAVEM